MTLFLSYISYFNRAIKLAGNCLNLPIIVLASSLLVSCSWFTGSDMPSLQPIANQVVLKVIWEESIGNGQGRARARIIPAVDEEIIYVAAAEGLVEARNRLTGRLIWDVNTYFKISGGIRIHQDKLLLGSENAELFALEKSKGELLWTKRIGGEMLALPAVKDERIVVQALGGYLAVVNAKDGNILWSYRAPLPLLTLRKTTQPLLSGNNVYAGFPDGKIVALDVSNGGLLWEHRIGFPHGSTDIEKLADLDGTPVIRSGKLYGLSYQDGPVALNLGTAYELREDWRSDIGGYNDLAVDQQHVYFTDRHGTLFALNQRDGSVFWQQEGLLGREPGSPILFDKNYLLISDGESYLHIINKADGSFHGRIRLDKGGIRAPMVIYGDEIYIYTNRGTLLCVNIIAPEGL